MVSFFKQSDKQKHMLATGILTLLLSWFFAPLLAGIAAFLLMSLVKEFFWDKYLGQGCFDYLDILANFIGASVITGVLYLLC